MADIAAPTPAANDKEIADTPAVEASPEADYETASIRPAGWKYKPMKLGFLTLPWYASPKAQLAMVSFVCFLCPGMFNALGGLGGGGKTDATLADNMVCSERDLRPVPHMIGAN